MTVWETSCALALGWVVLVLCIRLYHKSAKSRPSHPLPPGPPGLPWIGNVIGVDTGTPWFTYSNWAKKYGDLIYSRLLGKDIIIINSEKIARDLLEKRSGNYSDRPYLITNDLCGLGFNSGLLHYGDRWRLHRRFFHDSFRVGAVSKFLPVHHRKGCRLLQRLFHAPEQLKEHIFEYTVSVILNSVYDYDPFQKDKLVDMVAKVLEIAVQVVTPSLAIVVNTFPVLLHLPSWLPGMGFKKKMEIARKFSGQYVEKLFAYSLQKTPTDHIATSMIHGALGNMEEKGISPDESWMNAIKEAAATAFLAGSETVRDLTMQWFIKFDDKSGQSNSVLMMFFLMMVTHPGVQEKAQAQIDTIVGRERLPTINDRASLPYIDAIFREILRFSPPIPLSVPHATLNDDVYADFHIPKGAIVIANLWSMAHNESKYPNPHIFLPERFLDEDGLLKPNDTENIAFGFGRRICVGRHFADISIWSVIVKVLAMFTISKALDENGDEIPVQIKFSSGPSIHPLPFQYKIAPRIPGMDAKKLEELVASSD